MRANKGLPFIARPGNSGFRGFGSNIKSIEKVHTMLILIIGMAEMVFSTLWAKYVQETRIWASTVITMSHVFVWYFVLKTVIEQLNNLNVVFMYAIGCGLGNMLAIMVGEYFKQHATSKKKRGKKQLQLEAQQTATISAMPALITYDNI